MKIDTKTYRALLACDAGGTVRVLATDSQYIVDELINYDDAEELGIPKASDGKTIGAGLWLWEGTITFRDLRGFVDLYPEREPDFHGETKPIQLFDERLGELFAMCPPEPTEDEE